MNHVELELSQRSHVLVTAGTWEIDLYDVDDVVVVAAAANVKRSTALH